MKRTVEFVVLSLALVALVCLLVYLAVNHAFGNELASAPYQGVFYERTIDGDTAEFVIPYERGVLNKVTVRFAGIDTPERAATTRAGKFKKTKRSAQCYEEGVLAARAKAYTQGQLFTAFRIDLVNLQPALFGRYTATVELRKAHGRPPRTMQDMLLSSKLAVKSSSRGRTEDWCTDKWKSLVS